MIPKLGYLCLCENPTAEEGRALIRQFVLVREADRMGYDDIWIGEHHFDRTWPGAGIGALLGHLAGVTSKARIGSMALLPALRDPIQLAEEVATLDLLSKGRFELGVASGAAFKATLQAHGLARPNAQARLRETMTLVEALFKGEPVGAQGPHHRFSPVTLMPLPQQPKLPIWVASEDETTLQHAARQGWGLLAAATHTAERVQAARAVYLQASGGVAPPLVLARFGCAAATREEAEAIARPYFENLVQRAQALGWGADPQRSVARSVDALLAQSLVGSYAEVARQFGALGETYGATRVAIVPTSAQFDTHKHILADFVDEVRPLLED